MEATEEVKVEKQEEKKEEGKAIQRSKTISGWYYHFKDTYGLSVCALLVFVYFNMGFRILMNLTMKDLFKVYLELEPVESQYFISLIALPWVLKVFIGIFVDNFKLFGTSRNIYLKISGLIMCGSLFWLQIPIFSGKYWALFLLMLFNLFNAIADVVTDAIMVIYARRDPEHGSSDLQTLHIISLSIGGITGSVVASYANEYFHPYYVFSFYAWISVFHTILAYIIEEIWVEEGVEMWDNIAVSLNHLKKPIVFGTIIFIIISRGIIPSYASIMYYYLLTILNFSKQTIALLDLIAFWTAIIGSVVYNLILKEIEFRKIMIIAHILIGISVIPTYSATK